MKTKKFLMIAAAAALLFAACGKDEENSNNNASGSQGGGSNTPALADNTIVYDGVTYHMTGENAQIVVEYYHNELTHISARSTEQDSVGVPRMAFSHFHIRPEMWNKTQNLTTLANEEFYEIIFEGTELNLVARGSCYESGSNGSLLTYFGGNLDGTEYDETQCLFSSGTYTVTGHNDGSPFTVEMDATLINGKRIQMKLTSPDYHDQVNR